VILITRSLRIALALGLVTIAAGCAENRSELDAYIESVKQRPGGPLPPIPVMREFPSFEYAARDLRDPFSKGVETSDDGSNVPGTPGTGAAPVKDRRKEELESYPLDSLDMVGTMGMGDNIAGLIKDPAGVIHRVRPDNYLGQNHGRITDIYEDRIVLTELFPNGLGGWDERTSEIALENN
jgi:type IV pilus assembly protein PilP